ncbi:MAG TPA: anhydro-N-acetylmuramic acid kinase, partial [Pseudorhizobium sp.]|nr:anhydro-N-acetylmuramic acid kinase [Pseudorhizobium sp.]
PRSDEVELADGARTLAFVAAASVLRASHHLPRQPALYIICGGGRLNGVLMGDLRRLAAERGARVISAEEAGSDGDAMEAEAWAYLAVRALKDLPLTFPQTTGVKWPVTGGVIARPADYG